MLDDRKSLSNAFLAISDQYATFFNFFFSKWMPAAILEVWFGPVWMTENLALNSCQNSIFICGYTIFISCNAPFHFDMQYVILILVMQCNITFWHVICYFDSRHAMLNSILKCCLLFWCATFKATCEATFKATCNATFHFDVKPYILGYVLVRLG